MSQRSDPPMDGFAVAKVKGQRAEIRGTGFAPCRNQPIFEAVTTTGLLLERVDEALHGHC
jgi:hypothetical protein